MKAVVIEKQGAVALREVEKPSPPPGFVRVAVKAAAVCATDLEAISGGVAVNYPLIPGHEWSGVVDAAADDAGRKFIGKRVTGSNDVVCHTCPACVSGNLRYCPDFKEIGFKKDGAYAEYVCVPAYGLCELPDSVPFTSAALAEPIGVALGTLDKADAKAGETLLVIGAGSIGLCMLQAARAIGMRKIVVAAQSGRRLSIAKKLGAFATVETRGGGLKAAMEELHPGGSDVVVDATGAEACIQDALKIARKGGRVALAGYGKGAVMSIRIDDIHINNLKLIGAGNNWNKIGQAVRMMGDGAVDPQPLVTETLRLEQYDRALELARTRPEGFVKAVFVF